MKKERYDEIDSIVSGISPETYTDSYDDNLYYFTIKLESGNYIFSIASCLITPSEFNEYFREKYKEYFDKAAVIVHNNNTFTFYDFSKTAFAKIKQPFVRYSSDDDNLSFLYNFYEAFKFHQDFVVGTLPDYNFCYIKKTACSDPNLVTARFEASDDGKAALEYFSIKIDDSTFYCRRFKPVSTYNYNSEYFFDYTKLLSADDLQKLKKEMAIKETEFKTKKLEELYAKNKDLFDFYDSLNDSKRLSLALTGKIGGTK